MRARRFLVFLHDVVAATVAWMAAFWLRFNFDLPPEYEEVMTGLLLSVTGIHAAVFWALGLYKGLWRYASVHDLQRIVIAVGIAAMAVPALLNLMRLGALVPRTVYVLTPLLLVIAMGASRLAYRAWREGRLRPGDLVLTAAFGAGLAWGANLIRWTAELPREPA